MYMVSLMHCDRDRPPYKMALAAAASNYATPQLRRGLGHVLLDTDRSYTLLLLSVSERSISSTSGLFLGAVSGA